MFDAIKRKTAFWMIEREANKMPKSWRTTLLGLGTMLGAAASVLIPLFDGDPNTNPNWTTAMATLGAGWGLLHARDQKQSEVENETTAQRAERISRLTN